MTKEARISIDGMEDALPDMTRVSSAKSWLEEQGVKDVLSCSIDLFGTHSTIGNKPRPRS